MKPLATLAILLVASAFVHADVVVEQKIESPFLTGNMVMKIKGDHARIDVPSAVGQTTVLMDMKAGEMMTLLHAQKMVMKMNLAAAKKAAGAQIDATQAPKKTGEKEKVGAYNCEVYTADLGGGNTAKMWVTKDIPNYKPIMEQMNRLSASGSASMGVDTSKFNLDGMTVKTEATTIAGKVISTFVSAREEAIPDSEFAVPTGYSEMKMPGQN